MLFSHRTFVMVESPSYFEAYRYTLQALQQHDENTLPFQQYLLRLQNKPEKTPIFSRNQEFNFEHVFGPKVDSSFHPTRVMPFIEWPTVEMLDHSQSVAAQAALTQEISLIQGPPGTGKSIL